MENEDLNNKRSENTISRVLLEKGSEVRNESSQLYVLPAGGMHVAVPDLNFHVNHFKEEPPLSSSEKVKGDRMSKSTDSVFTGLDNGHSDFDSEKKYQASKLPFGLELTAGPGKKSNRESLKKKNAPPSQTLLASASAIKSYFNFSQEKNSLAKSKTDSNTENDDSVKNRVMGLWHNMKYGWSANLKTNFSRDTPIYLLGKVYHKTFKEEQTYEGTGFTCSNIDGFKKDFASIGWFTYRQKFPPLPESLLTTDCGWGCMIRSGQMMMLTALRRHFLPQDWKYHSFNNDKEAKIHRQIMMMFCDDPSPKCPFSLHNLILFGHKMNKKAGNWYGPSCVAHMFKDAVDEGAKEIPSLKRLALYVAQDGAVYVQDVLDMCTVDYCLCSASSKEKNLSDIENKSILSNDENVSMDSKDGYSSMKSSIVSKSLQEEESLSLPCDIELLNSSLNSFENLYSEDDRFTSCSSLQESNVSLDHFVDRNRKVEGRTGDSVFADAVASRLKEGSYSSEQDSSSDPCSVCHGWKSCIIFIPVRLGGSSVNPIYYNCIYSLFLHDLCIGIIGGRPKHSLYFVGFQDESLIHLDPHLSQDAVPLDSEDFPLSTYHCFSPRKIAISKMDPSATIGFYCHTRSQFFRLLEEAPMIATAKDGNLDSPVFEFVDGRSEDINGWIDSSLFKGNPNLSVSSNSPTASRENEPQSLEDHNSPLEDTEELVFQ